MSILKSEFEKGTHIQAHQLGTSGFHAFALPTVNAPELTCRGRGYSFGNSVHMLPVLNLRGACAHDK